MALDPDDVKRMRKRMRLTQVGLAHQLGVHRRTVQSWEAPVISDNHRWMSPFYEAKFRLLHNDIFAKVRMEP